MTPSWRTVGTGLRLVQVGARVIGWALAATVAFGCGLFSALYSNSVPPAVGYGVLGLFLAAFAVAAGGRVTCAVGRWKCLAVPPEAATARARIWLAVILETCGLLSAGATLLLIVLYNCRVPLPVEVCWTAMGFSALAFVVARVCYFHFALSVAVSVNARTDADSSRFYRVSWVAMSTLAGGVLLTALSFGVPGGEVFEQLRGVLGFSGSFLLVGTVALLMFLFAHHSVLVAELRRLLVTYTPPPPDDDPDAAYRERHVAGGGSVHDA
jgi:hypothetical protein